MKHLSKIAILAVMLMASACTSMNAPMTKVDPNHTFKVSETFEVVWKLMDGDSVSYKEKSELERVLREEVSSLLRANSTNVKVLAKVTRIEKVNPLANVATSLLVLLPLDRGGAAIEFSVFNKNTGELIAHEKYAKWSPVTNYFAHFEKIGPAKKALISHVNELVLKLRKMS